jgi:MYXO-CTERM domain-containing protein
MDGESGEPPSSLPWEHKAAIVCLGALSLLELHAGIQFFLGKPRLGFSEPSWSFGILLLLYVGLALGIRRRRPLARWMAVLAVGAIGLFMAGAVGTSIWESLTFSGRARSESSYAWYQSLRPLEPGDALLLGFHCALLFAVPPLMILGALRKELRSS